MQGLHNDAGTHTVHSARAVPAGAGANDKLPIGSGRSRCLLKPTRADDSCISIHHVTASTNGGRTRHTHTLERELGN